MLLSIFVGTALYFAIASDCITVAAATITAVGATAMSYISIAMGHITLGLTAKSYQSTAYVMKTTAMCFFTMMVIMTGACAWILLSALRALRTATAATIRAIISARACIMAMTTLSLVSALLRYAIAVDYMATVAMFFGMGILSCIPTMSHVRSHVFAGILLCITDIIEYNIRTAVAIFSLAASIRGYISKKILKAMHKLTCRRLSMVVLVLCLVFVALYMVFVILLPFTLPW